MTRTTPPDDAEDAPDEAHDADEARVQELRDRIARGEYRVDPEATARRILERGDLEAAAEEPAPPALWLVEEPDAADAVDESAEEPREGVEEESGA